MDWTKRIVKTMTRGALKGKIFILMGGVTMLAVGITIFLASALNYRSQKQDLFDEVEMDIAMMQQFSELVLAFEGLGSLQPLELGFDSMLKDPSVMAMVVYNGNGEVVSFRSRPSYTQFTPPPYSTNMTVESTSSISMHRAVESGDEVVGAVFLEHDTFESRHRFKRFVISGIVAGVFALFLSFFIALIFGRRIAKPVEELSSLALQVSKSHDFSLRATYHSDDEIGQLVSQFNTMLERIEMQNTALSDAHEVLEQRIVERTRELDLSDRALNAAVNGVVITRVEDDSIIYCNEAMVKAYLWCKEELLQHTMRILQGAKTDLESVEKISESIQKGQDCKVTMLHYRKDGQTLWNEVSIAPVSNTSRQVTHYIWVLVDVTEALEKETSLRVARDEAEKANKAKSEFLSRMSHELRTPLNSIIGFSKLLSMSGLAGKANANINRIHQAGLHLLDLINEVLDISRIETGNLSLSLEEIDLQGLIHEVGDLVRPMATDLNVSLVFDDQNCSELKITADKQRLRQVFLNLASNGIKYNRDGGTLRIFSERTSENRVRVVFQNTGEGIPESKLDRLFQPFDRLDAERDHYKVDGTGLGLALSKKLTEAMGGKIWVRSILGKETQFFVELDYQPGIDLANEEPEQFEVLSKPEPSKRDDDHRLLVLYVEDNPDNLALMEQILEQREGVKLMSAIQGRQGYDLARQHLPDVIFLDLNLSDINGDKVLHLLKSDPVTKEIPVYMLSADVLPTQIKQLKASGALDYLMKPIDIPKLHAILEGIHIST